MPLQGTMPPSRNASSSGTPESRSTNGSQLDEVIDDEQVAEEGDPQQHGIGGAAFGEQMLHREAGEMLIRRHR